jgi:hypothetical protein
MCNAVLENGNRSAFWRDKLPKAKLEEVLVECFARYPPSESGSTCTNLRETFQYLDHEELTGLLVLLVKEAGLDIEEISIDCLLDLQEYLSDQQWIAVTTLREGALGKTKTGKSTILTQAGRLRVYPGDQTYFGLLKLWRIVPAEAVFDRNAFNNAFREHHEVLSLRIRAVHESLSIQKDLTKLERQRRELVEREEERVREYLADLAELDGRISQKTSRAELLEKDKREAPEIAVNMLTEHLSRR